MRYEKNAEFRFLDIPNGEDLLPLLGSDHIRKYGIYENGEKNDRMHFHNLMEIAICRMGSGEVNLDNKWYPYKNRDIIVVPHNFPHVINSHDKNSFWERIYVKPSVFMEKIHMDIRKQKRLLEKAECRPFIINSEKAPQLEAEINLIMNQNRIKDYGYKECIKGLMFALLMEIVKINHAVLNKPEIEYKQNPQKVKELSLAFEYIEKNYSKDLRISDIANAAYVSETHLRRLFMESCAISPMQYVKKVRIEAACKMIKSSDVGINEIAYTVGYENLGTFISNFKKIEGCTPKQWKNQNLRKTE